MLEQVIDKAQELLPIIGAMKKEQRELGDNALRAVSHALNETNIYYKSIESGKSRNEETEAQLVRYWSAAAIPMRHIDQEFAEICEYKSQYWLNPEKWTPEKVREFRIGLRDVGEVYMRKLRKESFLSKPDANSL